MTKKELLEALEALYAFGDSVDSGISDPVLKERCRTELEAINRSDDAAVPRKFWARAARRFVGKKAVARGYGLEDLIGFLHWVRCEFDMDVL